MSFVVYPAIDLRQGKVVRLREGDPAQLTAYSDDPVKTARHWLEAGASWLHVVNLDGAFGEGDSANRMALESILKLGTQVQFGGGMRSLEAIENALDLGVTRVVLGTVAIENPELVMDALARFGPEQIAVGIDARDGLVQVRGWKNGTATPATDLALRMRTLGLTTAIFTDVSRDGMGRGLNIDSTRKLAEVSGLNVIASGGVHTIADVIAAKEAGLAGCIIGRALYEGTIDLKKSLQLQESKV